MATADAVDGFPGDALLAGATGLVGHEVVRLWPGPGTLHLLARRRLPEPGPNRRAHVVDFAALPPLPRADSALCCLGTTIAVAGSKAAFRAVDHDAVLAFARAAQAAGARSFAVVSALGAERDSASSYTRVKGEVEDALAGLGFATLVIARPSLLAGDRAALGQPERRGERLALALTKPLLPLVPLRWRPIDAARVAQAMLRALADPASPGVRVLGSAEMQTLGR